MTQMKIVDLLNRLKNHSIPAPGGEERYLLLISVLYIWFTAAMAEFALHLSYSMTAVNGVMALLLAEILLLRYLFPRQLKGTLKFLPYAAEPCFILLFIYFTGGFASLFIPLAAIYLLLVYQYGSKIAFRTSLAAALALSVAAGLLEALRWLPVLQPFSGQRSARFVASYYQLTFLILGGLLAAGWLYSRLIKPSAVRRPAEQPATDTEKWQAAKTILSDRELEIVQEAYMGLSNREIAEKFVIQEDTVKSHLNKAYKKLNVKNRVQLIKHFSVSARSEENKSYP